MNNTNKRNLFLAWVRTEEHLLPRDLINTASLPTGSSKFVITGLKPETTYEVKMSAINGKGEGESSAATTFKTEPVRKYCPRRRRSPCSTLGPPLTSVLFLTPPPARLDVRSSLARSLSPARPQERMSHQTRLTVVIP